MNRFDEKVYRVPKRKDGPSLADQKGQLVRLKQDLEQFRARQAGAAVVGTLQARIRELEASISRAEAARMMDRQSRRPDSDDATTGDAGGDAGGDASAAPAGGMRATSSRFPPRGRPGRTL
ncbi:Gas vesicle protein V [Azospirillum sp. sgz302134]